MMVRDHDDENEIVIMGLGVRKVYLSPPNPRLKPC